MFLNYISRECPIVRGSIQMDFTQHNLFTYSRDAIYKISKMIKLKENDEVLIPNYICNTVIDTLHEFTRNIKLYKVDNSLKFNDEDIKAITTTNTKMIIFVDYFGVESEVNRDLVTFLKKKNVTILKDSAHSFLTLMKNQFISTYEYDYLVTSIYKNLQLHAGALASGSFDRDYRYIDGNIIKKKERVLFIKKLLCFLGINMINRGIENLKISHEKYTPPSGKNVVDKYVGILNTIDYKQIISRRDEIALEFYSYFESSSLFSKQQIEKSSLQAFPLVCSSQENRNNILTILREKCIDAFTWPTFHEVAVNEELWSKILLLPLDKRVLNIVKEEIEDV